MRTSQPPSKNKTVLGGQGVVLLCQNLLKCGILDLQTPAGLTKCFFFAPDVLLARTQRKGEEMSDWLKQGSKVRVNARRVSQNNNIPFIATTVWVESEARRLTEEMKNKVFKDIPQHLMDKYNKVSADVLKQYQKGPSKSSR